MNIARLLFIILLLFTSCTVYKVAYRFIETDVITDTTAADLEIQSNIGVDINGDFVYEDNYLSLLITIKDGQFYYILKNEMQTPIELLINNFTLVIDGNNYRAYPGDTRLIHTDIEIANITVLSSSSIQDYIYIDDEVCYEVEYRDRVLTTTGHLYFPNKFISNLNYSSIAYEKLSQQKNNDQAVKLLFPIKILSSNITILYQFNFTIEAYIESE